MQFKPLVHNGLNAVNVGGEYIGPLLLRVLLAVEFGTAGLEKLHGSNWFVDIQQQFPFPFNVVPADISWALATTFELVGAVALVLGIGVRFFALSLMILTIVAIAAVHWPSEWHTLGELAQGYAISDAGYGNYKLPLIYLVMFVPLILQGPGRASVDALIYRWFQRRATAQA